MRIVSYDIDNYVQNQEIPSKKCNSLVFRNVGDVDAEINGIPLLVGEVNSDFQNFPDEVIVNKFSLAFKNGSLGVNPRIVVIRVYREDVPKEKECNYKRD